MKKVNYIFLVLISILVISVFVYFSSRSKQKPSGGGGGGEVVAEQEISVSQPLITSAGTVTSQPLITSTGTVTSQPLLESTGPVEAGVPVPVIKRKPEVATGGETCDPSLWSYKPVKIPTDFISDTSIPVEASLCDAQTHAQKNDYNGFIMCKDNGIMFLQKSFTGIETVCTDCKLYYTQDFSVNLTPDVTASPTAGNGCPTYPYNYCETASIEKVYVTSSCKASDDLIKKLISEKKLYNTDDARIVKCCKNPEVCNAAGVRGYPTVVCSGNINITGFCP